MPSHLSIRLDKALVQRRYVPSRTRAQQLIDSGAVLVNGSVEMKSSFVVEPQDSIIIDETVTSGGHYVSRGALKLVEALSIFGRQGFPSVEGKSCLDIGASTGGFTQVLLGAGAKQVIALDVGHDQLESSIARDERVYEMSGVNIRDIHNEDLPFDVDIVVSDVSFISLEYVLPVVARIARKARLDAIMLIKPQFEVGRGKLGKGGIVTNETYRHEAVETVVECAKKCGFELLGLAESPIMGTHGNQEFLMWITMHI